MHFQNMVFSRETIEEDWFLLTVAGEEYYCRTVVINLILLSDQLKVDEHVIHLQMLDPYFAVDTQMIVDLEFVGESYFSDYAAVRKNLNNYLLDEERLQYSRFNFYTTEMLQELNLSSSSQYAYQIADLIEQDRNDLAYIGLTYISKFYYNYLHMETQQILETWDTHYEMNSELTNNVYYLNRKIFDVETVLSKAPLTTALKYSDLLSSEESIYFVDYFNWQKALTTASCQFDMQRTFDYSQKVETVPNNTMYFTLAAGFTPTPLVITVPITTDINAFIEFAEICTPITYYAVKSAVRGKAVVHYDLDYNFPIDVPCDLVAEKFMFLEFNNLVGQPFDIAPDFQLKFQVNSHATVTYGNAKLIQVEEQNIMSYKISLEQIATSQSVILRNQYEIFLRTVFENLVETSEHWLKLNAEQAIDWAEVSKLVVSRGSIPVSERYNVLKLQGPRNAQGKLANTKTITAKLLLNSQDGDKSCFSYITGRGPNSPALYMSATNNFILYTLDNLGEEVQDLQERVDTLEAVNKGMFSTILDVVGMGFAVVDLVSTAAAMVSVVGKASKRSKNALKKRSRKAESSLGKEFKGEVERVEKLQKEGLHYSPLDNIEYTSFYNVKQNHYKTQYSNEKLKSTPLDDFSFRTIFDNADDVRDLMQIDSVFNLKIQKEMMNKLKRQKNLNLNLDNAPFGTVTVHKSPISILGAPGKWVSAKYDGTDSSSRAFLSNSNQRFPFHTAVSVRTVETANVKEAVPSYVLTTRFSGVGEPSIIGPTNKKNPAVKMGYVKVQHSIVEAPNGDLHLELVPWHKVEITPGRYYTAGEIDQLHKGLYTRSRHNKALTTEQKWEMVALKTATNIDSRNVIDSIPISNSIYLNTLDSLMFFSKNNNSFKYNLFNNNCQTFSKAFAELATKGTTSMPLNPSDFKTFSDTFASVTNDFYRNNPKVASVQNIQMLMSNVWLNSIHRIYNNSRSFADRM